MLKIKAVFLGLILLSGAGCYRISYKFTLDQGKTFTNSYWNNYFIYGLAPVKDIYTPADLCGNGSISRLDTKWGGANILSSIFSLGFTGANTINVQCIANNPPCTVKTDKNPSAAKADKSPGIAKADKKE